MTPTADGLAGIVLAAGLGTRLAPLTSVRPKALCPVNNQPLLEHALQRLAAVGLSGGAAVAVNAHHHAAAVVSAAEGRATVSVEQPGPLGSAGALGALRAWIAGRSVLVTNADAYLDGSVDALLEGWDGERIRLLVVEDPARGDFGRWRFAGCSLMPWREVASLLPQVSGLYETCWRRAYDEGRVDLVPYGGTFIDCGTPAAYLAANLHASGGGSVIGTGAVVDGELLRSVVWPGARVEHGERLVEAVRADGLTVQTAGSASDGGRFRPPPEALSR